MRRIVVTGARGQLGRQVLARAAARGRVAVGFGSDEFDITDAQAARRHAEPNTLIVNCAAYTAVDQAETDVEQAFAGNATGPRVLAEACADTGAGLIHVSTDYVFDGTATAPYETDAPVGPVSVYGKSKLAGEQAIHEVLPQANIVRTAWVYTGADRDFVASMRRLESERDTIDVVDDQIGSPTYAADLADALLDLADHLDAGRTAPPVLHATNSGQASWFELARAVFSELGADPERVHPCTSAQFVRPAPRPGYSVLSDRAWRAAGLTPLRSWRSALHAAMTTRP
ncbi:dTDP-4-dehydrorhamnose reductase [Skermania sp. ID1734]|uniref:dTDP-4-dehydrorhamnose reductase n=1 Tax=Skermania sp. ID1734 TaxID=2597516 RepID=UPI00117F7590|nr:dTDP-4-dehydrorhamnose reductase [Skermania sp. ID1734]TSD97365.1 dTDP-4-dehydrorhamnose reductase [Skermania sp. ID1734]